MHLYSCIARFNRFIVVIWNQEATNAKSVDYEIKVALKKNKYMCICSMNFFSALILMFVLWVYVNICVSHRISCHSSRADVTNICKHVWDCYIVRLNGYRVVLLFSCFQLVINVRRATMCMQVQRLFFVHRNRKWCCYIDVNIKLNRKFLPQLTIRAKGEIAINDHIWTLSEWGF